MSEWISVNDSMPGLEGYYLTYASYRCTGTEGRDVDVLTVEVFKKCIGFPNGYTKATHWMPLPEPPEAQND